MTTTTPITTQQTMARPHANNKMLRHRRTAIILDDAYEIEPEQTNTPPATSSPPGTCKKETSRKQKDRNGQSDDEDATKGAHIHHIRIGRRTVEDEAGDIPTQFLVIARIDTARDKVTWLSVATWQLNGLRIGSLESGDAVRQDDEIFAFSTGLDPDPYFFARDAVSLERIKEVLLEIVREARVGKEELRVVPETMDDGVAMRERDEALWAMMAEQYGAKIATTDEMRAVVGQDAKKRFPCPWALPVAPTRSWDARAFFAGALSAKPTERARKDSKRMMPTTTTGQPKLNGVSSKIDVSAINVVATFVNKLDDRNLRLKHFIQADFEFDETLESAKKYFRVGDGGDYCGLEKHAYLSRKHWKLELWVLPQVKGCSTLYKWDDVAELPARAFFNERALKGEDVELKLYVEVRIVQDPRHLEVESDGEEDSD